MHFLPLVGNTFLRKVEQPYYKSIARLWLSMLLKKGCGTYL
uniref:Uncharacterized protein n=1 Tax=Elizabethkingia anophelis TaxID=1117645 RepID=A0A455ZJY6_9FLAO|nr:TPA_exp: hypothetical protein [Elizabethkingia anophelis]